MEVFKRLIVVNYQECNRLVLEILYLLAFYRTFYVGILRLVNMEYPYLANIRNPAVICLLKVKKVTEDLSFATKKII